MCHWVLSIYFGLNTPTLFELDCYKEVGRIFPPKISYLLYLPFIEMHSWLVFLFCCSLASFGVHCFFALFTLLFFSSFDFWLLLFVVLGSAALFEVEWIELLRANVCNCTKWLQPIRFWRMAVLPLAFVVGRDQSFLGLLAIFGDSSGKTLYACTIYLGSDIICHSIH